VDPVRCPYCSEVNPGAAAFCNQCGHRLSVRTPPLSLRRYTPLRFQVDPSEPPPVRDPRWVLLVLGISLAIVGGFLLIVDAILGPVIPDASGFCGPAPNGAACGGGVVFEYVFLVPGLVLLIGGAALAAAAFIRVTRGPAAGGRASRGCGGCPLTVARQSGPRNPMHPAGTLASTDWTEELAVRRQNPRAKVGVVRRSEANPDPPLVILPLRGNPAA